MPLNDHKPYRTNRAEFVAGTSHTPTAYILMQTAIYCGVSAAVDAFRSANEVFNKIDKK